jgi:sulfite exporter TauE/SafE
VANLNLLVIFLTGLTTGGLTCMAVQGGLLVSSLAKQNEAQGAPLSHYQQALPILSFLVSKLIAYSLLGALLGWLGSVVSLSPVIRGYLQIAIGLYLLGVAGALLDLHPLFRYFIITPPKFLMRFINKQSKRANLFTPALLGALTVFIPCATTQAMEIVALGTGNPLYGALVMFAFVLGTSPVFFTLGYLASRLSTQFQSWFYRLAAAFLVFMAIFTVNGGIALTGSIFTIQNFVLAATTDLGDKSGTESVTKNGTQEVTINVANSGYSPNQITLKQGIRTKVTLNTNSTYGCSRSFTIPSLGIQKILPMTGSETVEFTPTRKGSIAFSCSMGMYNGIFKVI